QSQLFQFVLATSMAGPAIAAQVSVQIFDSSGQVVFSLIGQIGQTVSGASILLTPGTYQVSVSIVNVKGKVPPISYWLGGASLSEPIGVTRKPRRTEPCLRCPGTPRALGTAQI